MHDHRASHAGAGGCGRSSAIIRKISWNICRGMATSAVWKARPGSARASPACAGNCRDCRRAHEAGAARRCPRTSCMTGAFSGSIQTHGSVPSSRSIRSAMTRSARCRPARKIQSVSPTRSAMTVPSASSRLSAVSTRALGTSESPRPTAPALRSAGRSAPRPLLPSARRKCRRGPGSSPSSRRRACDQGSQGSRV